MTGVPLNPAFLALSLAIVAASLLGLGWLLRGEPRRRLLALALLTAASLGLRLLYPTDYPTGLNEDEPKVLYAAGKAVANNTLLAESNISVPILPHALFQGQLIPLFGPWRWAIRSYNLIGGVLCTPAAYAAARALLLSASASFAVAAFVTVLPWSLFYSRVMTGNELMFFELLLLGALGTLVFEGPFPPRGGRSGWGESAAAGLTPHPVLSPRGGNGPSKMGAAWAWLLGSFALAWLLYGYWPTRVMLPMVVLAALLASGRRRLWCLAVLPVALALYAPYLSANRNSMFIGQGADLHSFAGLADPLGLVRRLWEALLAFVWPLAEDGWLTVRSAAMHPFWLLLLAVAGVLQPSRRALFVAGGFLLGLAPTVFAWGPPSTHRMVMAYPFIALAAGCGLDRLESPRLRRAAAVLLVLATAWWGVSFYFSDAFWTPDSRRVFDGQRTALIEALPPPDGLPVVFLRQISYFRDPRRLVAPRDTELTADNWFPRNEGAVYAFTWEGAALRPFYEQMVGAANVWSFADSFTVTFAPGDWSGLRRHGWSYVSQCGGVIRTGQVPTLYQPNLTFAGAACDVPTQHRWRARWDGPATPLRLRVEGVASVQAGTQHLDNTAGTYPTIDFTAEPGMEIQVDVTTPPFQPWVYAALLEHEGGVPAWNQTSPLSHQ
jgi:hypothetical protein